MLPKYGIFETFAARWTDHEAWCLIDGVWKSFPPGEVITSASMLTEAEYTETFGKVPNLPSSAFSQKF